MSSLAVNNVLDFNSLKEYLGLTDGNLASHLKALEKKIISASINRLIDRKPNTKYFITKEGTAAFEHHIRILEEL
jgi:DNA-binding MarR family transcriptional regulator